jgi:DNA-binding transcriptional MerR regulator
MKPLLLSLPDDLANWRGTAADLAEKCNELLGTVPSISDDAGAANERLVRHYVQVGVLSPPDREGREALFGLRQVVEFLATRYLLKDGWPLAKAAEIVRATDVTGLTQLIPSDRLRTRAEEVVAKYRSGVRVSESAAAHAAPPAQHTSSVRSSASRVAAASLKLSPTEPPPASIKRPASQRAMNLETPMIRAADISRRRVSLEENLKALGNTEGRAERQRIVRIELTPWCHVHVDVRQLGEMSEDTPEILGTALTQALQEERIQKKR